MKITVSLATFNEIASLITKDTGEINDGKTAITLLKGTAITPPIDFRLVTIRRDCADIVAKVAKNFLDENFITQCNDLYNFVLKGEAQDKSNKIVIENKLPKSPTDSSNKSGW